MKRVLCTTLMVVLLMSVLAVPAFAAGYTGTIVRDFSATYNESLPNSPVTVSCSPTYNPIARTSITVPTGATGRVMTGIYYKTYEVRSSDSNTVSNGRVECEIGLRNYTAATQAYHYANRRIGSDINYWEYYFVDPDHNNT